MEKTNLKIKLLAFVLAVIGGVLFSNQNTLSVDDCIPDRVTIPGNQTGGHIELSSGQSVSVVAEFSGNCTGRRAEFKICYQTGSACEAVENSNILGNQAVTDRRATLQWTAQKNPLNAERAQSISVRELSGSIIRQSLPVLVLAASEETTCKLRGVKATAVNGLAGVEASTNSKCEGENVIFFICTQNAKGTQECNTNFGQAKVANNAAKVSGQIPSSLFGNTTIFFRASIKLQSLDSAVLGNQDFTPDETNFQLKSDIFKFKIDNPLAGKAENVLDILAIIANFIFQLGVPVAVIVIIYSGILFLVSSDKPAIVQKATNGLKYAAIGLAVLLIGKGFVSLIQSILSIR